VLTLSTHRQSSVEALAHEPCTAALITAPHFRYRRQRSKRGWGQIVHRVLSGRRQIRQPVLAGAQAKCRRQDGIELGKRADVAVGHIAYRSGLRLMAGGGRFWHGTSVPHRAVMASSRDAGTRRCG